MSYIIPKIWLLLKHFDYNTPLSFTEIEKQGFNPKTLTKYLRIAQENNLIRREGQGYKLTGQGAVYQQFLTQIEEFTSFPQKLEKISRREIHSFLQIHVAQLKSYYSKRLKGVVLFGSSATTRWRSESDIDLFIVVQEWTIPTWERAVELYKIRLTTLNLLDEIMDIPVSYYPLDMTETERFHAIYPDIQQQGIILWQEKDYIDRLFDTIREELKQEEKIQITTPNGESLWVIQRNI
jgi:predicted nucleotidyltransferase